MNRIINKLLSFIIYIFLLTDLSAADSVKLPSGWYFDRNVDGNRLMFRNLELSAFVEISEVPTESRTLESLVQGIAKRTGCLDIQKVKKFFLLTCDDKHIFIRLEVFGKNAKITRVGCHDKQRCTEAMKVVEQFD